MKRLHADETWGAFSEALINWRAIRAKRVLNIMKPCRVKLQQGPVGVLTKHFPLNLTTLI